MQINGVSGAGVRPNMMGAASGDQMDPISKDLQKQIESLQKQLQELSANQDMPMEAKMKKRQELQKQISDLEMQLRQRQMEVKREAAMKKREEYGSMDEMLGVKQQEKQGNGQGTGMSAGSMEALISADASMKQAGVHGSTARKMEGKAGVLKSEIDRDKGGPGDATAAKEEELAKVKELADRAAASQMESLAQANKTMQDAVGNEQKDEFGISGNDKDSGTLAGAAERDSQTVPADAAQGEENASAIARISESQDEGKTAGKEQNTFDVEMMGVAFSRGYQTVDIKL